MLTMREDWESLLKDRLPYGMWTLEDGEQVLFNRDYKPQWRRRPWQVATFADPRWWVHWVGPQRWFFSDCDAPWNARDPGATRAQKRACHENRIKVEKVRYDFLRGLEISETVFEPLYRDLVHD